MPNQHATPGLSWHPPAELSAWARAEAARRAVTLTVVLDEALEGARTMKSLNVRFDKAQDAQADWARKGSDRKYATYCGSHMRWYPEDSECPECVALEGYQAHEKRSTHDER